MQIAGRLKNFYAKYKFLPKRDMAYGYYQIYLRQSNPETALIALCHAMRLDPNVINRR